MAETAEIEVTPAMLDAGVAFYAEWDSGFYTGPFESPSSFVSELFSIMARMVSNDAISSTALE